MVCPIGLQPYLLDAYSDADCFDEAEQNGVMDCIECGCCAYTCPANRHLVQAMRLAKCEINNKRKACAQ